MLLDDSLGMVLAARLRYSRDVVNISGSKHGKHSTLEVGKLIAESIPDDELTIPFLGA